MVADASASPAGPSKPKGQRMLTWDEPGEWIVDPVKRLKHCAVRLGVDERGTATTMLIVKYEPGSRVEPHYHHSDYASIVVEGCTVVEVFATGIPDPTVTAMNTYV